MTSTKTTRRALLSSLLSLLLCCSMLLGTTFAWFTDSVTSTGNIIKSGTLDVTMEWKDATTNGAQKEYKDASKGAIFNYDLWEPGYVEAKNIKISNVGTLALKYQLGITAVGEVSKLTDAIDVYFAEGEKVLTDRDAMSGLNNIGTLTQILAGMPANTSGDLEKEQSDTVTIALKMREEAGNEYQNLSVGSEFAVQLLATQLEAEIDSFDNQYDKGAVWDGQIPTEMPETLVVDTEKYLISVNDPAAFAYLNTLVNDAQFADKYGSKWKYTIELNDDINLFGEQWTPINLSNFVAFEGNGHTISNLKVSAEKNAGLFGQISCNDIGVTYVRNLTIDGADVRGEKNVGALVGAGTNAAVENVTVNDATVVGVKYVGGIFGWGNGSVNGSTVKNSKIIIDTLVIDEADSSIDSKEAGGLIGYVSNDGKETRENKVIANNTVENVTITAPSIASGLVAQPNSSNKGGGVIEIKDNTMKNVTITTTHDASAELYVSNNVGGKSTVKNNTAVDCKIGVGVSTAEDLASALTADAADIVVALANDIEVPMSSLGTQTPGSGEYKLGGDSTKSIIIDLNGKKLTITTSYMSAIGAKNDDATITIKNGTMNSTGNKATTWNINDLMFANCNYQFEDVTFDKEVALTNTGKAVTMKNVQINGTGDYYALWIQAEGQTVTIDGLTVNTPGRGIKIDEQYSNEAVAKVTLNVANATFDTAKKAAIVVKSAAGADITLSNVDITEVAADTTNAVWVDEDAAAYVDLVTVTGGTMVVEPTSVSSSDELEDALASSGNVVVNAGSYTLPSVSNKAVTVSGTKDAVITIGTPAFHGSDVTLNGVTVNAQGTFTGIQDVNTVTYNDVTINGEMCLYGEKVVFNDCTFNLAADQYLRTYGALNAEFNNCTFNTAGKALLIYKDGGAVTQTITVKDCTFNASAGALAGAIANQNCAAIEIHNYESNITLITGNNTIDSDFSGEWRLKQYENRGYTVTVNGVNYTTIAIDGRTMTIDADKNVTVN